MITAADIRSGLAEVGIDDTSHVVVHGSLRSFGAVDGGAQTVIDALTVSCGTVIMMAGSGDRTGLLAPPGLTRPHNAFFNADDWADFDRHMDAATPYTTDLPVDGWLGVLSETLRRTEGAVRGPHPLLSFVGVGSRAEEFIAAETLERPLGALAALAAADGDVLLLGVDHTSNTTIHLAEQQWGRGHFYRYARLGSGVWAELPNVSGESHRFDAIEPLLRPHTAETKIGNCRVRRITMHSVVAETVALLESDPGALLCDDPSCRCGAARAQAGVPVRHG